MSFARHGSISASTPLTTAQITLVHVQTNRSVLYVLATYRLTDGVEINTDYVHILTCDQPRLLHCHYSMCDIRGFHKSILVLNEGLLHVELRV